MSVADAQAALSSWGWAAALELAGAVSAEGRDEADRLDVVAEACWWLGRLDECMAAREAAYRHYHELGEDVRAGQCAVWLWEHNMIKGRAAAGGAWLRRARRALADHPDCVEHGALLLREAEVAHGGGDLVGASALATRAHALGRQLRCPDLEAQALQALGRLLIDTGDFAGGLGHLDEAMLTAAEGRLSPFSTGKVYCSMISACELLGDLRRAAEWTDATLRWSEAHPLAMWPGICRVHHASLLQQHGQWDAAEREARRACVELEGFHIGVVAAGHLEIGEVRRRLGDLVGAEESFARAEALCGRQAPGLALVRLAQGRVEDATAIITAMLGAETWNKLARGRLLPVRIQIAVAAGDLATAAACTDELEGIAMAVGGGAALAAAALTARGRLQLAQERAGEACGTLRRALEVWSEIEVPYEIATTRLLLGHACRLCGDEDGATRSLAQAAEIFDRLGTAGEAVPGPSLPGGLTEREAEVLRLVAAGKGNRQIATALHLSERTVARHLSNVFVKIGVGSRTAAAAFAFEHGLTRP